LPLWPRVAAAFFARLPAAAPARYSFRLDRSPQCFVSPSTRPTHHPYADEAETPFPSPPNGISHRGERRLQRRSRHPPTAFALARYFQPSTACLAWVNSNGSRALHAPLASGEGLEGSSRPAAESATVRSGDFVTVYDRSLFTCDSQVTILDARRFEPN
jgi:hypothetical protein